jgi:DNA (cytosine-5)-methyltransferase 1
MMRVLDLFSGIGGFSLGLERAGMTTAAFCEIDPFCRRVLAKHWPKVPCYDDVQTLTADRLRADGIAVDVICGGFPCQDISFAGAGAGLDGERSGLWREYARLIGELRPSHVIVENVAALLGRGLDRVLGDLATLGYDAEWHCIPAAAVGAPHRRDRVWIIAADANGDGEHDGAVDAEMAVAPEPVADANGTGLALGQGFGRDIREGLVEAAQRSHSTLGWWSVEPGMGRVADGVPSRMDRLRALGNAVVPQIPELIGRAIMSASGEERS